MARKQKQPDQKNESPSAAGGLPQAPKEHDSKPTAGEVKEEGFENTTWEQHTDHDAASTEAERKNTAKTLPGSSEKNR
ncbi:MAG TPA: hypothetical protein VFZ47_10845 [Chitinophagaceae bacterium]